MMSNSPPPSLLPRPSGTAGPLTGEFLRPFLMAELVEDSVDHLRLLAFEEGMREIDIFGDDDARRHVPAHQHLVGAGAQDGAQDRIDAVEPPAFSEVTIDQGIDAALLAHHALDDVAEELRLGVRILAAFDFLPEPVDL